MLRISRVKNDAIWVGRNKRSGIKLKAVINKGESCRHCIFLKKDTCRVIKTGNVLCNEIIWKFTNKDKTTSIFFIRYVDNIRDGEILDFG